MTCALKGCRKSVPEGQRKYCSAKHAKAASDRAYRKRIADRRRAAKGGSSLTGDSANKIRALDLTDQLLDGTLTPADVAIATGLSVEQVRLVRRSLRSAEAKRLKAENWDEPTHYLGPTVEEARERFLAGDEAVVDEMLRHFWRFLDDFFYVRKGMRFIIKWYHELWLRRFIIAILTGARQMVLSPPRHGKSKLLAHFVLWLIIKDPDIRVLWIAGNEDLAKLTVRYLKDQLQHNEPLRKTFLRPGQEFKGEPWSTMEFSVGTRTIIQTAPTVTALGCNGTIQNRDADVIVCDDIDDWKRCQVDSAREKTREWFFGPVQSRWESYTAWFVIGSRQHADDLYSHMEVTPGWADDALIMSIHAPFFENSDRMALVPPDLPFVCTADPLDDAAHVECMMFPEVRSYEWWQTIVRDNETRGLLWLAEMEYMNVRRAAGTRVYAHEMFAPRYNPDRDLGLNGLPRTTDGILVPTLVGGLDPSATGYQAGFLWGMDFATPKLWMVDADNRRGGGEAEALQLFQWWLDAYGCRWWVIEDNMYRKGMRNSRLIMDWADRNGVVLEGHETQLNKHHPQFGVTCFVSMLGDDGIVDLPAASGEARAKAQLWERQMIAVSDRDGSRRRNTDVGMASWFPMKVWFRHLSGGSADADVPDDGSFTDYAVALEELALTSYGSLTHYGDG